MILSETKIKIIYSFILIIVTFSTYYQVLNADFVAFDDPVYVTDNAFVNNGLTVRGLKWAFSFSDKGNLYWQPLTFVSHMADSAWGGMNPKFHHLTSLIIHLFNAILFFCLLNCLQKKKTRHTIGINFIIALIFSIHPVHCESVAWISCRKNVLSLFFWLLTLILYLKYTEKKGIVRYWAVVICFVLGMMSKAILLTLPFVLFLLDFWPLKRFSKERLLIIVLEKIPLLIIAAGIFIAGFIGDKIAGKMVGAESVPIVARIVNGFIACLHYLIKFFIPANLVFFHPYPEEINLALGGFSIVFLVFVSVSAFSYRHKFPFIITGWAVFVITLLPVSGLFQRDLWPLYAERYAYIPYTGLAMAVAAGLNAVAGKENRSKKTAWFLAAVVVTVFIVLTVSQVTVWKDSQSLFSHAVAMSNDNYVAHNNLGFVLMQAGKTEAAEKEFKEALKIRPHHPGASYNMGLVFYKKGLIDEAERFLRSALKSEPYFIKGLLQLGTLKIEKKEYKEAMAFFDRILAVNPLHFEANNGKGLVLASQGRFLKALSHFNTASRMRPEDKIAEVNYEKALHDYQMQSKIVAADLEELKTSDFQTGNKSRLLLRIGSVYSRQDKNSDAWLCFKQVMTLQPENHQALKEIIKLLKETGEWAKARQLYTTFLEENPDYSMAVYYNLACIASLQGLLDDSLGYLEKSVENGFKNFTWAAKDPELDPISKTPEFIKFLEVHMQN